MSKYLKKETKDTLKENFKLTRFGWVYKPPHRETGVYLNFAEIGEIHDFVIFQGSQEYLDWVKMKAKELHND